jgi:hypothetical protein
MPIGIPELVMLSMLLVFVLGPVLAVVMLYGILSGRAARRFGYANTRAYLAATPRTDAEKRDAADLAMKGLVLCMLGVLFPPFVLAGLIPLFYGGRKLAYAWMGLGLIDDPDPGA